METGGQDREALIGAGVAAVEAGRAEDVDIRILGGVAVALRCPSARGAGPLARDFSDVDFAVEGKQVKGTVRILKGLGYVPNDRFNAANGERRLLFLDPDGRHVDVFVDRFMLCHELDLRGRFTTHPETLPLADLLLTKLQVAKLSQKDVTDMVALLLDHDLVDDGDEGISTDRVAEVLSGDWGWWRTSTETLERLTELLAEMPLGADDRAVVAARIKSLDAAIEAAPKSIKWRARARIGERRSWREDPDEMEA